VQALFVESQIADVLDVTVLTLYAERRSDELHGGEDLVGGNALENLNVLELLFSELGRGRGLFRGD
jgi:hypothetical protein